MTCHGCATKFGFFTKERECLECKFAYCSSCLKHKVDKLRLCRACFLKISSHGKENKVINTIPSYAPQKQLEALENPSKPPITVYRSKPRMQELMKGLSSADLEIARRLEKLREDRSAAKSVPTEDEMARRLAVLRGEDPNTVSEKSSKLYIPPDTRSGVQQADDLFNQVSEEVTIDAKQPKFEDDIATRLECLRSRDAPVSVEPTAQPDSAMGSEGTFPIGGEFASAMTVDEVTALIEQCKLEMSRGKKDLATIASLEQLRVRLMERKEEMDVDSDDDEVKATQKIISKAQAEVELERRLGITTSGENEMDDDTDTPLDEEEFPWCIICNEDAAVRCMTCDRDLYCKSCYQEGHKDPDMHDHISVPFQRK